MCFGRQAVRRADGGIDWLVKGEFSRLVREGIIVRVPDWFDDYEYARDPIGAYFWKDNRIEFASMRWDLVSRDYRWDEDLTLADLIRKKDSKARDPATGQTIGFDSYNARVESITTKFSYRKPWAEGRRMVTPVVAFKERPNMDDAPAEFKGKEYEVALDGDYLMGGIWDRVTRRGESLDSCSIITMDSKGHLVRSIWHERLPFILRWDQIEEWLDPRTPPDRALAMVQQYSGDRMELRDITRPKKPKDSSQIGLFD